jgi:hypothetical protein
MVINGQISFCLICVLLRSFHGSPSFSSSLHFIIRILVLRFSSNHGPSPWTKYLCKMQAFNMQSQITIRVFFCNSDVFVHSISRVIGNCPNFRPQIEHSCASSFLPPRVSGLSWSAKILSRCDDAKFRVISIFVFRMASISAKTRSLFLARDF